MSVEENVKNGESAKKESKENDKKPADSKAAANRASFYDRITDESRTAKYSEIVENIKKVK